MAEQPRDLNKQNAPDASNSYERSHPENESGMGRMDKSASTPTERPDQQEKSVPQRQESKQINAHDVTDARADGKVKPANRGPAPEQPDHSMHDEEPDGWDQAPMDIHDPKQKRHPRTEGKGGTE